MNSKKNLTLEGLTTANTINILCGVIIIGITIYLSNHFFQVHFPSALGNSSALCDFGSFFNCDGATTSSISNIFGIPIAFFGMVFGIAVVFGAIFPSEEMEKTTAFLSALNIPGVLFLLVYSLAVIGSICPMCFAYYFFSGIILFLHVKHGIADFKSPSVKILSIYAVITIAGGLIFANTYQDRKSKSDAIAKQIVEVYNSEERIGNPSITSPFRLYSSTEKFEDAAIQLSIYSDFECPYCGVVSKQIHDIINSKKFKAKFAGKINIQYFFYPLDNACNPQIQRAFHQFACKAAMVASCDVKKFGAVHDHIFENQKSLSDQFLKNTMNKFGLKDCFKNKESANFIGKSIQSGEEVKVKSTPTLILNGVKIEGALPTNQLFALFEELSTSSK